MNIEEMTVKEYVDSLTEHRAKLKAVSHLSAEPFYTNFLLKSIDEVSQVLSIFDDKLFVSTIYPNSTYLTDILLTSDLFINNPDMSVHSIKQEILKTENPLTLRPILDLFLNREQAI